MPAAFVIVERTRALLLTCRLLFANRSYPFFDPVLTDRAFLNEPRTMVKSFTLGGTVAGIFILLFGFLGMFGNMQAILRPDACATT